MKAFKKLQLQKQKLDTLVAAHTHNVLESLDFPAFDPQRAAEIDRTLLASGRLAVEMIPNTADKLLV
jgi:hypothetical protein